MLTKHDLYESPLPCFYSPLSFQNDHFWDRLYIKMGEFGSATGADPTWNVDATAEQWANFTLSAPSSVPEPGTYGLAGAASLLGFVGCRRFRRRTHSRAD
ncbi:MAG: PEP-CTERM sorting domain-containing protein [Verrucomicrobiales bacterium]|nr:PEP-CTERM sorting domain-containing protein [Verrucomicrobiales bacterium]